MAGDIARSHHNSSGQSDAGLSSASSLRVQLPFPTSGRRGWFHPQKHKWGIRCLNSYNPLFIMPERDHSLGDLCEGEATIFWDPECPPHFVSPSKSGPSNEVSPFLDLLFPNVPKNAKENNILLKVEELKSIEKYLNSHAYCSDYDVTIVIDQGASIVKEVRNKLYQLSRKARVNCAFNCCILTMVEAPHARGTAGFARFILDGLNHRWKRIVDDWLDTDTTLLSGPISDFYRRFTHFFKPRRVKDNREDKQADSSFIEIYSEPLCDALGMSPVPSLAIETANSDDIRKLFYDCISWLVGSYLRVNTVIGVNISRSIYTVDILNFNSTVDNLLQLADDLDPQLCPVTREALLLSAKMKASVNVLQLRLLQYLLDHQVFVDPTQDDVHPTQDDVDALNDHLAEDIALAQSLCPDLEIKDVDLERFPDIDTRPLVGFEARIPTEIEYYQNILNRQDIRDLDPQLQPRDAIVSATYAIIHNTVPQTFGPISKHFAVPGNSAIRVPRRALCTLIDDSHLPDDGDIIITGDELSIYLSKFPPKVRMMNVDLRCKPIPLEWINNPRALSTDQRVPLDQLMQANYNPRTTLGGHIKFRFLTFAGLSEIARAINAPNAGNIHLLVWHILRTKSQRRVRSPLVSNPPPMRTLRDTHAVRRELGPPQRWINRFARQVN